MRLPHDEAGSGPPVILLHAGIADRTMWREHLEPLATAGYRVIALDLPAFGEAPAPRTEDAPWNDVLETMDALGVDRAALVGNSFGGAVALRVAFIAPERVAALALISAPPPDLDPSEELQAVWKAEEAALDRGDIEAAVQVVVDAWTLPEAPAELKRQVADMQRNAFVLQSGAVAEEAPDPLEENPDGLASLNVTTLVAAGDREFSDFRKGATRLAATLPRAQHTLIAGAGHLAPLETPEVFRAELIQFLSDACA